MKKKLLIVVDVQNDFIDGALANPEAQKVIPDMVDFIKTWNGDIIATKDTHYMNYLETSEGKYLPIKHCIFETEGWDINKDVFEAMTVRTAALDTPLTIIKKLTFGYDLWNKVDLDNYDEVVLIGFCTDICVISNALIIKAQYHNCPNLKVKVISSLCAGTTPEKHNAALEVMKSCQIEVE